MTCFHDKDFGIVKQGRYAGMDGMEAAKQQQLDEEMELLQSLAAMDGNPPAEPRPAAKPKPDKRRCLKCEKWFEPKGPFHVCPECKKTEEWRFGAVTHSQIKGRRAS